MLGGNPDSNWIGYPASFGDLTTTNPNGTPADAEMNISADPEFFGGGNYHILASSPAVNAGTASQAPATDYDGDSRLGAVDIGFDEVNDLTPPTVTMVEPVTDPHHTPVNTLDFTFSEAINVSTLTSADLTLTRDGGANLLTGSELITLVAGNTYRISGLDALTEVDGAYVLTVDASGVRDVAGNTGTGLATTGWTMVVPPDIRMLSATADGFTTLSVTYEIIDVSATVFELGVYRSSDETFGGDTLLTTVTISEPADLTVGTHVKTWVIGSGGGEVPLPGAGAAEVDSDYFLLFVADPADAVVESDPGGIHEDNVTAFSGLYHAANGLVLVHGGSGVDTVSVSGETSVSFNGATYVYATSDMSGLRARTHGGNDVVNAATLSKEFLVHGGEGDDTLTGGNAGNDTMTGGGGNDTYVFGPASVAEADIVAEGTNQGSDTLSFASLTTAVTLNLNSNLVQAVHTNRTLKLNSGSTFENIIGGSGE